MVGTVKWGKRRFGSKALQNSPWDIFLSPHMKRERERQEEEEQRAVRQVVNAWGLM